MYKMRKYIHVFKGEESKVSDPKPETGPAASSRAADGRPVWRHGGWRVVPRPAGLLSSQQLVFHLKVVELCIVERKKYLKSLYKVHGNKRS